MDFRNGNKTEFAFRKGIISIALQSACTFFFTISMIVGVASAPPASAQQSSEPSVAELIQEQTRLEAHRNETQGKLDKARQVRALAQEAESKAKSLNDSNAESVARQAMTIADRAIETNQSALAKDEADLAVVDASLESRNTRMPASAATLVDMLNSAAQNLKLPKGGVHSGESLNCKFYFQSLGAELRKHGLSATAEVWSNDKLSANDIVGKIKSGTAEWKPVSDSNVQELANRGVVVVGLAGGASHGHIAVAFPTSPGQDLSTIRGQGPFIRDGDEHSPDTEADRKLYPSTWGAVKASKVFSYRRSPPEWYVWTPSMSKGPQ